VVAHRRVERGENGVKPASRLRTRLVEPHGHQHVQERSVDLDNAGAQFVGQFNENLVGIQIA